MEYLEKRDERKIATLGLWGRQKGTWVMGGEEAQGNGDKI